MTEIALPRFPLAQLPTPLETLPRLRAALAAEAAGRPVPALMVKRDDLTGVHDALVDVDAAFPVEDDNTDVDDERDGGVLHEPLEVIGASSPGADGPHGDPLVGRDRPLRPSAACGDEDGQCRHTGGTP